MTPPSEPLYIDSEKVMKICVGTHCPHAGKPQPLSSFCKDKKNHDGLNKRCRDCQHNGYLKGRENTLAQPEVATDLGILKTCIKCLTPKPLVEFHKCKRSRDGRNSTCKKCRSTRKPRLPKPPEKRPEYKICSREDCPFAGVPQPIDNFYEIANQPYRCGIDSQCKSCRSAYSKSFYAKMKLRDLPPEVERVCSRCHVAKPIGDFAKHPNGRGGISAMCRTCEKKRQREWRSKNLEQQLEKQKAYYRKEIDKQLQWSKDKRFERFGVDRSWYDKTISEQNFCCAICGSTEPKGFGGRFAIDHDHDCCPSNHACDKCRRGLLCFPCNARLAHLESEWMQKALEYLKTHGKDISLSVSHFSDGTVVTSR